MYLKKKTTKTTVGVAALGNPHCEKLTPKNVGAVVFKPARETHGITLMTLIITIVIMLIIAGVTIGITMDGDGLADKAQEQVEKTNNRIAKEDEIVSGIIDDIKDELDVDVSGVVLDTNNVTLKIGDTKTITATVVPQNSPNKAVTWSSSDESIVTVNNGLITAIKTGTATITATTQEGNESASCTVTVEPYINYPNEPILVAGMTPIKFRLPEGTTAGITITTNSADEDWYNYEEKKWANAKTKDGSMWVWIPRYAYKINESTQTTEVVFLSGTTDNYLDEAGNTKIAQRAKTATDVIDTTSDFTVHPAFTNESGIGYRNGGWNKELTGIWVAKFEAGYPTGNNTAPVVASNVRYSQPTVHARAVERPDSDADGSISARNWLDGIYGTANTMPIKYPTFQPLTYSMNYINHSDAYLLAKDMTSENNIYGFTSSADTHLMKDSEWGAIAYFSKSKYGLQSTDIAINNVNMNSGGSATTKAEGNNYASVYGITGVTRRKL